jgi:hypothetical protein
MMCITDFTTEFGGEQVVLSNIEAIGAFHITEL